ncbi:hypothetical protein ZIOFF_003878 [Zingiber officinale]|uniref:Uncharacterized protein n=1 Tax=Zingiber officinale TaxID=94328 RepID=A0A8J5IE10_ZINOF|nr:hypothetical protein ZIOFF_003878 [Zingiber officinale]
MAEKIFANCPSSTSIASIVPKKEKISAMLVPIDIRPETLAFKGISAAEADDAMPPKLDLSQVMDVFVCVASGKVGATSSLASKICPLGLSPKVVGEDIVKETTND